MHCKSNILQAMQHQYKNSIAYAYQQGASTQMCLYLSRILNYGLRVHNLFVYECTTVNCDKWRSHYFLVGVGGKQELIDIILNLLIYY